MRKPPPGDRQFDLFVNCIYDMPLRDQGHAMERPFFSLSKNKRIKPIEYHGTDKDGEVYVKVEGHQKYGMATIWDADILIWVVSKMIEQGKKWGNDDMARTHHFHPYDLLKAIRRRVGGDQYIRLRESLDRLQTTTIQTNIRAKEDQKTRFRRFGWIDNWSETVDKVTGRCTGMSLCISDWLYEAVHNGSLVLEISPDYFLLDGGIERWLYRVARKHAGHKDEGFRISVGTLFEKSGIEDDDKGNSRRKFKSRLKKIVAECNDGVEDGERTIAKFPDYYLEWIEKTESGGSAVCMTERDKLSSDHPGYQIRTRRQKNRPSE